MAKGIDFLVKIGTSVLGGQRGATLNRGKDTIDTTTKQSGGWKEFESGLKEWGVEADGLLVEDDIAYAALEAAYLDDTAVTVEIATPSGAKYSGSALITDFPIEMPYEAEASYSVTFQGTGPLVKAAGE